MKRFATALALTGTFLLVGQAQGQEVQDHQVREEVRSMVMEGSTAQADRAVVSDFLERSDVGRAASERGLDLERVKDGVQALSAKEASRLAQRVQEVDAYLAGGDTFVITSTTVIIILLVLILIAVA